MTRLLAWVVAVALAGGCGAGNAEVRTAKTATYHGNRTELLEKAAQVTVGDYKLAGRTDDGFVTVPRWYNSEGGLEGAGAEGVSQIRPNSVSVSFEVSVKEAAGPGDAMAVTVTPITLQYVQGSPKPRELKPDDPYLPPWVLGRADALAVKIHDALRSYEGTH